MASSPLYKILSFGSNGEGQLGLGHFQDVQEPSVCLESETRFVSKPKKLVAGGNHTLVLCDDGSVYATGSKDNGQCPSLQRPMLTSLLQPVEFVTADGSFAKTYTTVAATWEASLFVTTGGQLYTCGVGLKGELGHGPDLLRSLEPRLVRGFPTSGVSIVELSACVDHVVAVLSDGSVYGWGNGRKGQLGAPNEKVVSSPRKIETYDMTVCRVVCGRDFTVLFGAQSSGDWLFLGQDKWRIRESIPKALPTWIEVGASWTALFVLEPSGKLLGWGRNTHAQLPSNNLPPVERIEIGSEHVLAELKSGQIIAWGWQEHGNCGPRSPNDQNTPVPWNYVSVIEGLTILGAGCATSWLYSCASGSSSGG